MAPGVLGVGAAAPITILSGLTGPVIDYLQGCGYATSSSGHTFGISPYLGAIYLPSNYQSNAQIAGRPTY